MVPGAAREAAGPMMTQPVCIVPESPGLASTPRFAQHPCNVAFEHLVPNKLGKLPGPSQHVRVAAAQRGARLGSLTRTPTGPL